MVHAVTGAIGGGGTNDDFPSPQTQEELNTLGLPRPIQYSDPLQIFSDPNAPSFQECS
jgi:hypothetical protein